MTKIYLRTAALALTTHFCLAQASPASQAHPPVAADHSSHAPTGAGVSAETAFGWLKNGNTRYLKRRLRKDGQSAADRTRLAAGQHPHTVVLSCADSRVPPELVFDQKLGEIFVIRSAGEVLDFSVVASIEYAVEHLGPQLLVVMGHTSCGAVKAALDTLKGGSAGSADLDKLVGGIHPHLKGKVSEKPSAQLVDEVWLHTKGLAGDLTQRSEIIRKKVEAGQLQIRSALYHLDSGRVEFEP